MKQSKLFPKTKKSAPKDAESINHRLLVRAGYIDQLMSGSWTLLPLGWKVVEKINDIIREELDKIGAQEVLMPLLHPKGIWNETERWDRADEIMYKILDMRGKDYALSFTHEEIFLDLVRKHLESYRDLPIALYHFSTKFRNEPRARSGILRGREFMMKDLYSIHESQEDFDKYYEEVKKAYKRIFEKIGFNFKITEAGGGVFTDNFTHEFQVPSEGGEDTIYYCKKCEWAVNEEVFDKDVVKHPLSQKAKDKCPECAGEVIESSAIEVGNVFPFGTYYSEKMNVTFADTDGEEAHPYFGSYGIGSTRVMGAWVETKSGHDEDGIVWSEAIAPFDAHLVEISGEVAEVKHHAETLYKELTKQGVDVLRDDRDVSPGEKLSDADLIGIPVRLVVSEKTLRQGSGQAGNEIEWKLREEDGVEIIDMDELLDRLTS